MAVNIGVKVLEDFDVGKKLTDTAGNTLAQIEQKQYAAGLKAKGVSRILKCGFTVERHVMNVLFLDI